MFKNKRVNNMNKKNIEEIINLDNKKLIKTSTIELTNT